MNHILLAHDLLTGLVVYWNGKTWVDALQNAKTEDAAKLEEIGKQQIATNKVLDVAVVELDSKGIPTHYREKIKTTGLTIKAF